MTKKGAYLVQAEHLYVQDNKAVKEIAALLPVAENTLYQWGLEGDWASKRRARAANPRAIADQLRRLAEGKVAAMNEAALDAAACDALYKIFLTIQRLERLEDMRVVGVQVMDDFTKWLREQGLSPEEVGFFGKYIRAWFRSLE